MNVECPFGDSGESWPYLDKQYAVIFYANYCIIFKCVIRFTKKLGNVLINMPDNINKT